MKKAYLGDGVYAEELPIGIMLEAGDNRIYLDNHVWQSLLLFAKQVFSSEEDEE